jgi:hypothetical protein
MTRQFDVVVEKDSEGYFVATVPALPGCHTQAKSLDDLCRGSGKQLSFAWRSKVAPRKLSISSGCSELRSARDLVACC